MACLMFVVVAFLLGIWVGAGWGAVAFREQRRQLDAISAAADRMIVLLKKKGNPVG